LYCRTHCTAVLIVLPYSLYCRTHCTAVLIVLPLTVRCASSASELCIVNKRNEAPFSDEIADVLPVHLNYA
jgi:hypothetical protein